MMPTSTLIDLLRSKCVPEKATVTALGADEIPIAVSGSYSASRELELITPDGSQALGEGEEAVHATFFMWSCDDDGFAYGYLRLELELGGRGMRSEMGEIDLAQISTGTVFQLEGISESMAIQSGDYAQKLFNDWFEHHSTAVADFGPAKDL